MERATLIRRVRGIVLNHANPERIWLYGSEAMGTAKINSDIDIAFLDEKCSDISAIREEIERLPSLVKVDVTNLAHVNERMQKRVITTGKVIYSASLQLRAEDGVDNFGRALRRFASILDHLTVEELTDPDSIYLDVAVKRFDFTFEMSWKAIKRVLAWRGIEASSPRSCFKEAYQQGYIEDQQEWLAMIESRNLAAHTYDETEARQLAMRARDFHKIFAALYQSLEQQLEQ